MKFDSTDNVREYICCNSTDVKRIMVKVLLNSWSLNVPSP